MAVEPQASEPANLESSLKELFVDTVDAVLCLEEFTLLDDYDEDSYPSHLVEPYESSYGTAGLTLSFDISPDMTDNGEVIFARVHLYVTGEHWAVTVESGELELCSSLSSFDGPQRLREGNYVFFSSAMNTPEELSERALTINAFLTPLMDRFYKSSRQVLPTRRKQLLYQEAKVQRKTSLSLEEAAEEFADDEDFVALLEWKMS